MSDDQLNSPDLTPSERDPGDETSRRYRYQWTYAAITSCMLLDEMEDISEVFCEHHEDVLIMHADRTFTGLQIKTRASDQEVWKANDPAVKSSCARFASLETLFPGQFRAFRFLTNHPLYSAGNGRDLQHVLRIIKAAAGLPEVAGPARTFLREVAHEAGCSEDLAFIALSKANANHDLPKLSDAVSRLVDTLTSIWPVAADCSHSAVVRAALALVEECGRASSLAHADVLPAYIPASTTPEDTEIVARITGKRIDKERLLQVLNQGLDETAPLHCDPEDLPQPGTGETALLRQKLDAGGFSAVSLNSAEDLRNKADYIGITWTKKYGRTEGLQRYGHIRTVVLSDSARAFETAKTHKRPFGNDMLSELRNRFDQRRANGTQLYMCSDDHLEGFAYSLTSECEVQWSLDRPWEDE